jgi:hypothetical protein
LRKQFVVLSGGYSVVLPCHGADRKFRDPLTPGFRSTRPEKQKPCGVSHRAFWLPDGANRGTSTLTKFSWSQKLLFSTVT